LIGKRRKVAFFISVNIYMYDKFLS